MAINFGGIGSTLLRGIPTDIFSRLGLNKTNVSYDMGGEPGKSPFNLNNFITQVSSQGLARPTWYYVLIHSPKNNTQQEQKASLLCCRAEFPSVNIMSNGDMIQGFKTEMPYAIDFPDITMEFYVDAALEVKSFFDNWVRRPLVDRGNTYETNYYNNYVANISICQMDAETNEIYIVELKNAWPKTVSGLMLSADALDTIHKLAVTFTYERWDVIKDQGQAVARVYGPGGGSRTGFGGLFDSFKDLLAAPMKFLNQAKQTISKITNIFSF